MRAFPHVEDCCILYVPLSVGSSIMAVGLGSCICHARTSLYVQKGKLHSIALVDGPYFLRLASRTVSALKQAQVCGGVIPDRRDAL